VLDELYQQMPKVQASEGLGQIAIQHSSDIGKLQSKFLNVLDDRTIEEKIEDEFVSYERIAKSRGKKISKETKAEFKGK
jgi:hypothetical protein